ncbi:hypothetical protein B2J93_6158 [Marssonina coronariae]|uniref:Nucleoporin NUP188 n=1 Tax=Diplocarpon coronariae TaxID=2795749 RepID=A0A218ZH51_9HELO|nr:hypothetical protein B2J93_6158 [Marssonina coronariae]
MAPILSTSYFPPLDQCLTGEELVVSWKLVSSVIASRSAHADELPVIRRFLDDKEVIRILEDPYNAYKQPSQQSKNAFDTKTSAINVTPSANAQYDIKEIKQDALWLSKAARIEEVAALRLVVEEYQSRASAQLLGPFTEGELSSIGDAAGNNKYSSSIPTFLMSGGADADIQKDFHSQISRRKRIFGQYLAERGYILKSSEVLLYAACSFAIETQEGPSKPKSTWLTEYGTAITRTSTLNGDSFILRSIAGVEKNIENISDGAVFNEDGRREDVNGWVRSQLTEALHSMEIIRLVLEYMQDCTSSVVCLRWFRLQQNAGFYCNFSTDDASIIALFDAMQLVSSIISVAVLGVSYIVETLGAQVQIDEDLSPNTSLDRLYIFNSQTILDINSILLSAADNEQQPASPAILAWSIILQTLTDRVLASEEAVEMGLPSPPEPYRDVLEKLNDINEIEDNLIEFLARSAVDLCRVFEYLATLCSRLGQTSAALFPPEIGAQIRMLILNLLKYSSRIGYGPEIMAATLSALTGGQNYWELAEVEPLLEINDIVKHFWHDEILNSVFLQSAKARYPFEALPFLSILRAVASPWYNDKGTPSNYAVKCLEKMVQFTHALPPDFADYETTQEEDNTNTIQLTKPFQLFVPRFKSFRGQATVTNALTKINSDFYMPAGTLGRMVSESGPRVASWFHQFSGLAYIGKLLETFLAASDLVDATTGMPASWESVAEIIELLATMISDTTQFGDIGPESQHEKILAEASSGLSHDRDVTSVIFDIFREELQNKMACHGSDVPLDVLVSCVHFIHAQIRIAPGRVWPLMTRCGLLDVGRGRASLPSIVEGVEMASGQYDFLISCCYLFDALVDDIAANAITRKSDFQLWSRRVRAQSCRNHSDVSTNIHENTLAKVLLSFARYLNEVLESSRTWKYNLQEDRRRISNIIVIGFDKILRYALGIDTTVEPDNEDQGKSELAMDSWPLPTKGEKQKEKRTKIMQAFTPAADYLVECFLTTSSGDLRFQSLLRAYFDGLEVPDLRVFPNMLDLWRRHVCTVLIFSQTLLRASALLSLPASRLVTQIFQASSLIARLYAADDAYKSKVIALFEALVVTASGETEQPPSLLGYLGSRTSRNFLCAISDLDKPLSRPDSLSKIWHFLAMVMKSRQHGFANYLLSGKTARDAVQSKIDEKQSVKIEKQPLLSTALVALSRIGELSATESLAMLEFIAEAQDLRAWTVYNSPLYATLIRSISNFIGAMKPLKQVRSLHGAIDDCYQTRIAAYIAEILSMHVFHSKQTGLTLALNDLSNNLSYFSRFAVAVPDYNSSLHFNLRKNFEARYPGCTMQDLKRTTLEPRQLGTEWFYDMSLADKMLLLDEGWKGRKTTRGKDKAASSDGLREEFRRANVNLSLVQAQIDLFNGWERLCVELTSYIPTEPKLQTMFASVVLNCLTANCRSQPPEEIFSRLSERRAKLAQILGQRLSEANSSIPEMKSLLPAVWTTISNLRGSFERPVPEGDVVYYRALLNLLYIALLVQVRAGGPRPNASFGASVGTAHSTSVIPIVLDILKHVVAMGFRELVSSIHESPADSSPGDLRLITGILQNCLRMPGIELCHSQIVTIMIDNQVPLSAIRLFSWSEKLAIDGDPIYGELSMLFLLELSSVRSLAEQLAIGGILARISSMEIMTYFQRPGTALLAESAGLQRCYRIWAVGILPLLLNILYAVESSIAVEVAQFLNQFPLMLTQSEEALDSPGTNRLLPPGQKRYITYTACSEVNCMAGLICILDIFRKTPGIAVPDVKWDASSVLENVEFWLGAKALLRERIMPMGQLELAMVGRKIDAGHAVSALEQKVVAELSTIRDVIGSMDT